jgi:DNA (cytosine-5)-methyltransferase 1
MRTLDLFSGIGGFSLGLERTGAFRTVAFCEIDPFCRKVLSKHWPEVRQYEDVRGLSGETLAADGISVDVICGGFPCQDISLAGKQAGMGGTRSGLWAEYARLIREIRPRYVIVENVAELLRNGMGRVLGDLSSIGYDAEWSVVSACAVGTSHARDRLWIVAYPSGHHVDGLEFQKPICSYQEESQRRQFTRAIDAALPADDYARMRGDFDDVPRVMDRLKMLGNAVIPAIPGIIGEAIARREGIFT